VTCVIFPVSSLITLPHTPLSFLSTLLLFPPHTPFLVCLKRPLTHPINSVPPPPLFLPPFFLRSLVPTSLPTLHCFPLSPVFSSHLSPRNSFLPPPYFFLLPPLIILFFVLGEPHFHYFLPTRYPGPVTVFFFVLFIPSF